MGEGSVGVLIVDDHALMADSLAAALGEDPSLEVLGVATTGAEAERLVVDVEPDVVLMDFRLPDGDGAEVTGRIRGLGSRAQVLMLTGYDDVDALSRAIDVGCAGFLPKTAGLGSVLEAVHLVSRGEVVYPAESLAHLVRVLKEQVVVGAFLTDREREVLRLMAAGLSTEDIARKLVISKHTARSHVRNILSKLDVHSKLEAVMVGLRLGLVEVGDDPPHPR